MKMKVTIIGTYDADPQNYPTGDPFEMAKIDMENFNDDPASLYDILLDNDCDVKIEPA